MLILNSLGYEDHKLQDDNILHHKKMTRQHYGQVVGFMHGLAHANYSVD